MTSAVISFSAILMLVGVAAADNPVTEVCLRCICRAISGCEEGLQCEGDACGLFRITWAYWAEAGKPVLKGISPDSPEAYSSCTNEPYCAARTIQSYMSKFGEDCNGDGKINCYDYMAIHRRGGYECAGDLPFAYVNVFYQCIAAAAAGRS